jgi:PPOX class probable F420-dependent enzyme
VDGDGAPRVLPVTFAVVGADVVSAVDHKPKRVAGTDLARVRWLRREPRAALTVDRYDEDWTRLAWVQLLGVVTVEERVDAAAASALRARYPPYRDRPPAGPLLRLRVKRTLCWTAS